MKTIIKTFIFLLAAVSILFAQGFKVKATGEQTFNFEDASEIRLNFSARRPLKI